MLELLNEEQILENYDLNQLIRYNTRTRITNESVAAHTFFVSLFCLKLFEELNISIEKRYEILVKALLHDIGEVFTSDIPHTIKADNHVLREIFNDLEKKYLEENWSSYITILESTDQLSYEILKLADIYSILQYTMTECHLGNSTKEMKEIMDNAYRRAKIHIQRINELEEEKDEL